MQTKKKMELREMHYIAFGAVVLLVAVLVWMLVAAKPAPKEVSLGSCRPTGCSSQVCSDRDVVTTCEFQPEYACYKEAVCERQSNGACGWTRTDAFESCVAQAVAETFGTDTEVGRKAGEIRINNIEPGAVIVSPLYLKGEARGAWFSGGGMDATLVDADGNVIAEAEARAQGNIPDDSAFVPFAVQFEFTRPENKEGFAVFAKKRLIGSPSEEETFRFPIQFRSR